MDFSKIKGKIFFVDKFINSKNAKIHVLNHSIHFATSVFEGIRVYNGKPLFLDEHCERLILSTKLMGLKIKKNLKELKKISLKLIKLNKINNGYIRPIVFRSSNSMSPETKNCKTLLAIASWNWGNLFSKKEGISLLISKYPRLNEKIYPIHAKSSGSYQTAVISRIEADKKKFDDCLMLDLKGNVSESSACNIFWVKKNIVYTPKEHSILKGITRKAVIKICKKNKMKILIGDYSLKSLMKSNHIFLTGTAAELQEVRLVNKKKFKVNSKLVNFLKKEYENIKNNHPKFTSEI